MQQPLTALLHPRSIAILVDGDGANDVAPALRRAVICSGYEGPTYVLEVAHLRADECGVEGADLAFLATSEERREQGIRTAASIGASVAVVLSTKTDGGSVQPPALLREAERLGVRIVGPNSIGVMSADAEGQLCAVPGRHLPDLGPVAVACQSSRAGEALLEACASSALGVRYFVSLGDHIDVSTSDLIAAWAEDDAVRAAVVVLESLPGSPEFARVCREFRERKPLLVLTSQNLDDATDTARLLGDFRAWALGPEERVP